MDSSNRHYKLQECVVCTATKHRNILHVDYSYTSPKKITRFRNKRFYAYFTVIPTALKRHKRDIKGRGCVFSHNSKVNQAANMKFAFAFVTS